MDQFIDPLVTNLTWKMLPENRSDPDQTGFPAGNDPDSGNNGAWGSVSYANNDQMNWTVNLTTEDFLEMMLGPKQVRSHFHIFHFIINTIKKKLCLPVPYVWNWLEND